MSALNWPTILPAIAKWVAAGSGLNPLNVIYAKQKGLPRPSGLYISMDVLTVAGYGIDWLDVEDEPFTWGPFVFTADPATGLLTVTANGRASGDGPFQLTTTGVLPAGLAVQTDYWLTTPSANTFALSKKFSSSMPPASIAIPFTDAGSGTHSIVSTPNTRQSASPVRYYARGQRIATFSIQCFAGDGAPLMAAVSCLNDVASSARLPTHNEILSEAGIGISLAPTNAVKSTGALVNKTFFEPRATMELEVYLTSEISETGTYISEASGTGTVNDPVAGPTSRDFEADDGS